LLAVATGRVFATLQLRPVQRPALDVPAQGNGVLVGAADSDPSGEVGRVNLSVGVRVAVGAWLAIEFGVEASGPTLELVPPTVQAAKLIPIAAVTTSRTPSLRPCLPSIRSTRFM
jgi:hypothetical protein